jgi:hypothetical protein
LLGERRNRRGHVRKNHIEEDSCRQSGCSAPTGSQHGLPEVEDLLKDLNDARKSEAYGDIAAPELGAEDVVSQIEKYVEAVKAFFSKEAP